MRHILYNIQFCCTLKMWYCYKMQLFQVTAPRWTCAFSQQALKKTNGADTGEIFKNAHSFQYFSILNGHQTGMPSQSNSIRSSMGIRPVCPLSPMLFNLQWAPDRDAHSLQLACCTVWTPHTLGSLF